MAQAQVSSTHAPEAADVGSRQLVIEINGASKIYKTKEGEVPSLGGLDFTVEDGEFVVIVGPSGCGKSTLLKLVAGLLPPTEGEIRVAGRRVTKPHRDVGIVFQNAMLLPCIVLVVGGLPQYSRPGSAPSKDLLAARAMVEDALGEMLVYARAVDMLRAFWRRRGTIMSGPSASPGRHLSCRSSS